MLTYDQVLTEAWNRFKRDYAEEHFNIWCEDDLRAVIFHKCLSIMERESFPKPHRISLQHKMNSIKVDLQLGSEVIIVKSGESEERLFSTPHTVAELKFYKRYISKGTMAEMDKDLKRLNSCIEQGVKYAFLTVLTDTDLLDRVEDELKSRGIAESEIGEIKMKDGRVESFLFHKRELIRKLQ